jgi:2'-5' RNA ligase
MGDTVRAFIAFELPPDVARLAGDLQARLKTHGLKLRWVRPQNIHLTLKFLGEIPREQTAAVADAMRAAAREGAPAQLSVQGMGVFPGMRKPRVVWIGLGGQTERLIRAAACLDDQLAFLGIDREERPFKAHLTIARVQAGSDVRRLPGAIEAEAGFAPLPFSASEMVLFQSDLRPQGPVYTPLARAALEG